MKAKDVEIEEIKKSFKTLLDKCDEMLEETSKKNKAERKIKGLKEGHLEIDGYFRLNQLHNEIGNLIPIYKRYFKK